MALITCGECGKQISDKASACIHCGAPIPRAAPMATRAAPEGPPLAFHPQKNGLSPGVRVIVVIAVVGAVLFFMRDRHDDSSITPPSVPSAPIETAPAVASDSAISPDATAAPSINTSSSRVDSVPTLPAAEAEFIRVVSQAQQNSTTATNDMQRGGIKSRRDRSLCTSMSGLRVTDWIGTVHRVNANSDGKGVLAISLAPDITVSTWNNDFSDMDYGTLIDPNTPLFQKASALAEGRLVRFSGMFFRGTGGDCVNEQSMTLRGKIEEPEFTFRFSSVSTNLMAPATQFAPPYNEDSAWQAKPEVSPHSSAPSSISTPSVAAPSQRPSFNCSRAQYLDERAVCQSYELSALDRQLASYFTDAWKMGSHAQLRRDEDRWLMKRRACQDNAVCIKHLYAERINELSEITIK